MPRVLAAIAQQEMLPAAVHDVWRDYVRDAGHARRAGEFRRLAKDNDPAVRELAYAVLLALERDPKTPARAKTEAERAIESAWSAPRETTSLLTGDRPDGCDSLCLSGPKPLER